MTIQKLAATALIGFLIFPHQLDASEVIWPKDSAAFVLVPETQALPKNPTQPQAKREQPKSVQDDPCGFRRPGPYREDCRAFDPDVWGKRNLRKP
jgi:pantothenate synthetase